MIEKLSRLKGWQIIVLGVATLLVALAILAFVAHLGYIAFPAAWGWILGGHIIVAGATAWFIPGIFVDALYLRLWVAEAEAYVDSLMMQLGEPEVEVQKPDLDVFEPEAERG